MKKSLLKSLTKYLYRLAAARIGDRSRRRTVYDLPPAASQPNFFASDAGSAGRAA